MSDEDFPVERHIDALPHYLGNGQPAPPNPDAKALIATMRAYINAVADSGGIPHDTTRAAVAAAGMILKVCARDPEMAQDKRELLSAICYQLEFPTKTIRSGRVLEEW